MIIDQNKSKTHLSAINVVENEIEFVSCLETVVQSDQERVVKILEQNISFAHDVRLLISVDDHFLLQHLDGVRLLLRPVFGQHHFAEAALSDDLEKLKVTWFDVQLFRRSKVDQGNLRFAVAGGRFGCVRIHAGAVVRIESMCRRNGGHTGGHTGDGRLATGSTAFATVDAAAR